MHTDICSLAPNQEVDDVYLLAECQLRTTRTNKYYLHAQLGDSTGRINARLWNATEALFRALDGAQFVRVNGRVETYQGALQLILSAIRAVKDSEVRVEDFLPATTRDVDEMYANLCQLGDTVENEHLGRLLKSILSDDAFVAAFKKCPAAVAYHQPFLGGLLEHTLAVTEMADQVASRYPGLDRDLLVTGAILHDIGKVEELSYDSAFDYTDRGRLIGHLIIAVQFVQDRVRQIEGFPPRLFDLLSHLILSHHGEYEWGSPKLPMTAEAIALHHLDNLDAKVEASLRAIETERLGERSWTEYNRMFERRFYRGPASTPEDEEHG